jgi:hypothetical protein
MQTKWPPPFINGPQSYYESKHCNTLLDLILPGEQGICPQIIPNQPEAQYKPPGLIKYN